MLASRTLLDPLFWEVYHSVGDARVRINYYDCLTKVGAENYFAQFQKENDGTEQSASTDGNAQTLIATGDDYCSVACFRENEFFVVTFYQLNAVEAEAAANTLVDVFLDN